MATRGKSTHAVKQAMLERINPEWRVLPWEQALAAARPAVAQALEKVLADEDLGLEDGLLLSTVEGDDVIALVRVADELRRRVNGDAITYVVNRNLNFTNVCIVGCSFCGFGRHADDPGAYFHSTETLVAKAEEAVKLGATEVCIQGGLPRDLDGYYYVNLLRALKARLPGIHIHAYSPMEICYGVEKTRLPLREYLLMLKEAGLNSIPGTAAEILDDRVRRSLSPNKLKVQQWIEVIRTAHSLEHPHHLYHDVRSHRGARALGAPPAAPSRHSERDRRLQRIRAARLHSLSRRAPFPERPRSRRPFAARGPHRPRAFARAAARLHLEYPGFLGEVGIRGLAGLPRSRRQRFWRHADGGKHLQGRRRDLR